MPVDAELPDVAVAPRGRRHDLLHVGHHRPAEGRARHPPQHLHQPDEPRLRSGPRGGPSCRPGAGGQRRPRTSDQNAYLLSVPFFHATGCHSVLVANLFFGGKIVIMHKWDAGRALELIERERITTFGGVPAMVWQVLEHPDFAKRDISSVRSIGYGGAPAAPELVRRIEAHVPGPHAEQRLRPHRDVVGHDAERRAATTWRKPDSVGVPVPVVRREGRGRRRRHPADRRGRRAVDQGPERREGLLEQAGGDGEPASPTAGSTRATSPGSTTRASSTSSTGPRT